MVAPDVSCLQSSAVVRYGENLNGQALSVYVHAFMCALCVCVCVCACVLVYAGACACAGDIKRKLVNFN